MYNKNCIDQLIAWQGSCYATRSFLFFFAMVERLSTTYLYIFFVVVELNKMYNLRVPSALKCDRKNRNTYIHSHTLPTPRQTQSQLRRVECSGEDTQRLICAAVTSFLSFWVSYRSLSRFKVNYYLIWRDSFLFPFCLLIRETTDSKKNWYLYTRTTRTCSISLSFPKLFFFNSASAATANVFETCCVLHVETV